MRTCNATGAGTGGATKRIFDRIGRSFASYDYTDISSGFFGTAKTSFQPYQDKMNFKVCNLDEDIDPARFAEGSYDMVVASLVIHATKGIESSLCKLRRLLRPGGYLVMAEAVNPEAIYPTLIFGCLEGWWNEGRKYGAPVPLADWQQLLLRAGFSGVDTVTPDDDGLVCPFQVIVSQAMDDRVAFIREPLSLPQSLFEGGPAIEKLTIIGGTTPRVRQLVEQVQALLEGCSGSIGTFESLEALDTTAKANTKDTVLVLEELDHPVFDGLTPKRFEALKHLHTTGSAVLWVTENRLTQNPHGNMAVGLERSIAWELPDLRVRFLDFEDGPQPRARLLAEALLRLHVAEPWVLSDEPSAAAARPLWSLESEMVCKPDGRFVVPRIRRLSEANDRLNSASRPVARQVDPRVSPVALACEGGDFVLQEATLGLPRGESKDGASVTLHLTHSSPYAIRCQLGFMYVVLGESVRDGTRYVGLTSAPVSIMTLPKHSVSPCSVPAGREGQLVGSIASRLLAQAILDGCKDGSSILVHAATPPLARALNAACGKRNVTITYTTSSSTEASGLGWTHVHPLLGRSQLRQLLPQTPAKCVDLTPTGATPSPKLPLNAVFGDHPEYEDVDSLLRPPSGGHCGDSVQAAGLLNAALEACEGASDPQDTDGATEVSIDELSMQARRLPLWAVLSWAVPCAVAVQPLDVRLRPDRTYWLVGLTGSLGVSTCDWMIDHGARNVVLSSRNPKVDPAW